MQIALFATTNRSRVLEVLRPTVHWLLEHGHSVRMAPPLAAETGFVDSAVREDRLAIGADLAISIGGDGTMLSAVHAAAPLRVPVLGVNAGSLGFLTEITPEELSTYLPHALHGDYAIETRMMIREHIYRGDQLLGAENALNDIVIRQGAQGRLIHLDILVSGHKLAELGADGLILSTPSGSTAYCLAAGGPIVNPATEVMVLTAICPHSLSFRPMVIPATDPVEIICRGNQHGDEMMVTADGQEPIIVQTGDRVIIRPADEPARLVKLGLFTFYDRLREKLQWGG